MEVLKRMLTLADEDLHSVEVTISETEGRIREYNTLIYGLKESLIVLTDNHMDEAHQVIESEIAKLELDLNGTIIYNNDLHDRLIEMCDNQAVIRTMVRRVCSHVDKTFDYYDPHECGDIYICECCGARVVVK